MGLLINIAGTRYRLNHGWDVEKALTEKAGGSDRSRE